MRKLRVLDLFSGIGGFSLGLERTGGFETVAFCEIEKFPRKILAKHWPDVPCFDDVRKLKGTDIDGSIDIICGGYPCQPFSTAGQRLGKEDNRHLWPEFSRLVAELRPAWVIGENVAGHISMGLDDVLSDLEGQGYACRTFVVPACAVNAPHRRDRVWTVAHSQSERRGEAGADSARQSIRSAGTSSASAYVANAEGGASWAGRGEIGSEQNGHIAFYSRETLANTNASGREKRDIAPVATEPGSLAGGVNAPRCGWLPEPGVGRVANGVPQRVDRLKSLGNAVVPQVVEIIGHAILTAERKKP